MSKTAPQAIKTSVCAHRNCKGKVETLLKLPGLQKSGGSRQETVQVVIVRSDTLNFLEIRAYVLEKRCSSFCYLCEFLSTVRYNLSK